MHRVCLCIKDICADLFHYFKLITLEQPHNWLFLFSGCQEPEGQRGKSTEWGGGTERESPQTWSVPLNIKGILLFTPREAFLEGNCKSFWFPIKENILKEPRLCGAYSSCHRAKGRVTPRTEDCSHSHSHLQKILNLPLTRHVGGEPIRAKWEHADSTEIISQPVILPNMSFRF